MVKNVQKLFGVIGDPIGHSMSPAIHNDAFSHQNIQASYHAFHVKEQHLEDAVKGFKAIGISGFNVTVPHKTAIIPFLDEMDELAEAIGAVNTVKNENGKLIGYNTDGPGYVAALKEEMNSPLRDKKTLIIGAGGAARGIYYSLVYEGVSHIDICNRTIEKAEKLIHDCPYKATSAAFSMHAAAEKLSQYDLIIQTTSIGMSPNTNASPLTLENVNKEAFVSDIIYNPLKTAFLQEAETRGTQIQNGIGMFVYQGALAFQIWTGVFPDTKRMKKIVLEKLGGTIC
jgi:shikimate dehydrogenase